MNVQDCTRFYENAGNVFQNGVTAHVIDFEELAKFDVARKAFARTVQAHSLSEKWDKGVVLFNTIHAKLARTPCRPSWLIGELLLTMGEGKLVSELGTQCNSVDQSVASSFNRVFDALQILQKIDSSPLLSPLKSLIPKDESCVVVLRDPRIWEEALVCLSGPLTGVRWEILKPSGLRNGYAFDHLVLFGPPWCLSYNNEEFLLRSPGAASINLVACAHEFRGEIVSSLLENQPLIPVRGYDHSVSESVMDFEPLGPAGSRGFQIAEHNEESTWVSDRKIKAVPFKLGGACGTYLEYNRNVWILEADLSEEKKVCRELHKVSVEELEPGDLLLMTTSGGGDMIPLVADMIMENSVEIRALQSQWKTRLWQYIQDHGYEKTISRLIELGSLKATRQNIQNWCSLRRIGMEDSDGDLTAVLNLIGMSDQLEAVARGFRLITSSHISAGAQLHRRLRENLINTDLGSLYKEGFLEVRHGDGPSKTIFIVEERGEEVEIPEAEEGEIRALK